MKRLQLLLIRLYPAWWRNRYGGELEALLEDSGSQNVCDLFRGAMEVQMKTWSSGRIVILCGLAGLALSGIVALQMPHPYQSTTTLRLHEDSDAFGRLTQATVTRNALVSIIAKRNLYQSERTRMPVEDVIDRVMRPKIRITPVAPNFAQVSFAYEDPVQAQAVSVDLAARLIKTANYIDGDRIGLVLELERIQPVGQPEKSIVKLGKASLGLPIGLLFGLALALILRPRMAPAT